VDIALIGVGCMGQAVASRLLDMGHSVTLFNRTASKLQPFAARGALIAQTPAEAIRAARNICLVLTDAQATREVLSSKEARAAMRGRAFLTGSLMLPEEFSELERLVESAGATLSEAQIMSDPEPVERGTGEYFVAFAEKDQESWKRIFAGFGGHNYDLGTPGNATKAVGALTLVFQFLPVSLAYGVAGFEKLQLPMHVLEDFLMKSPLSFFKRIVDFLPEFISRNYTTKGAMDIAVISTDHSVRLATALNLELAPHAALRDIYARACKLGYSRHNFTAIREVLDPGPQNPINKRSD
jgi:3-hydroxyisobutyrate dehydrogenase